MSARSLGRKDYLLDARDGQGRPVIGIMCTTTVYQRRDGSLFIRLQNGKRATLRTHPAYGLTLITQNGIPV